MIIHTTGISGNQLRTITNIWLEANLDAHWFIDPDYWRNYSQEVQKAIADAELFIFEDCGEIKGFLGLDGQYIAGLFVNKPFRHQGIGRQLLGAAKRTYPELTLSVYEKNPIAHQFYLDEGFRETGRVLDNVTGEMAIEMALQKSHNED